MKFSDEILMAYADGELDARQRAEVEQAMKHDPHILAQIESYRDLQKQLHESLSGVLSEPVPDRLLATLRKPAPAASNIVDFKSRRIKANPERPTWSAREWSAMAACLVVGVLAGVLVLNRPGDALVTARDGELLARGKLADALTEQLAASQTGAEAIQMKLSYRNQAGADCRAFVVREQQALAGLACRSGNDWRVKTLTETVAEKSEFRQAGSELPAGILSQVNREISGEAFDADAEEAARAAGWKK